MALPSASRRADVADADSTVSTVQVFANGVSVGVDQSFPYNFAWKPAGVGTVVLTAVATDSQGNRTPSAAVNVTVAAVSAGAPTVSVTSPAAGASLPVGVPVSFTAVAADADGSVALAKLGAGGSLDTMNLKAPVVGFIFSNKVLMYNLTMEGNKIIPIAR